MVLIKKSIKVEVIKALRTIIREKQLDYPSCHSIAESLIEAFPYKLGCCEYLLTTEVLCTSEDVDKYYTDPRTRQVSTFDPFKNYYWEPVDLIRIRKRFCELVIKNLEEGIFDIETDTYDYEGCKKLTVKLILTKKETK